MRRSRAVAMTKRWKVSRRRQRTLVPMRKRSRTTLRRRKSLDGANEYV